MLFIGFLLVVGASALSEIDLKSIDLRDERAVNFFIRRAVEEASQYMRDAGFDPMYVERGEYYRELPVPVIFNTSTVVQNLTSHGMSDIKIHSATFSFLSSRLNFDMEWPLVDFALGEGNLLIGVFGRMFNMTGYGTMEFERMRFIGQIRFKINFTSAGVTATVRSVKMNFTMGGINPDVNVLAQNVDYSNEWNQFLHVTIPETFKEYRSEINELMEIFMLEFINENLLKPKPNYNSNSTLCRP